MIRLGVIGYGYWGPNLVRNFFEAPGTTVTRVCDLNEEALARARSRYPGMSTTSSVEALIEADDVDAVAVATPVSTHFDLASRALEANKHVFVEKPLAERPDQCEQLIRTAEDGDLVLMVDHTFAYTGAVRKLKEVIDAGRLGDIYYYDSVRVNLGLFQHDVNVIWDLAVHDVAIMDFLLPLRPLAVSATGASHVRGQPENVAFVTLFFPGDVIAHVHVNWLAPVKVRQTLIGGSERMAVYNDLEPAEKVKLYEKGVEVQEDPEAIRELRVGYRSGDMWAPAIDSREALRVEAEHFRDCILEGEEPLTDGHSGLRVVRILQAATESMRDRGRLIELPSRETVAG